MRLVFDVAADPTPLLDAFSWSQKWHPDVWIDVLVFTSSSGHQEINKMTERRRVLAVARALQPHVHRCKFIVFDITFSSSLPDPTGFFLRDTERLEELTLQCRIDDIDPEKDFCTTTGPLCYAWHLPKLNKISMTAFWFMYLMRHGSTAKWLENLTSTLTSTNFGEISLHISCFKFPNTGHYTLPTFARYLSHMNSKTTIYFQDISLGYSYKDLGPAIKTCCRILAEDFHFTSVSEDFIAHFYDIALVSPTRATFTHCAIPKISQVQGMRTLRLNGIIENDDAAMSDGTSLRNILGVWEHGKCGTEIFVRSCPSFNDSLLAWLSSKSGKAEIHPNPAFCFPSPFFEQESGWINAEPHRLFNTYPADVLDTLHIHDCPNFTVPALRAFIQATNAAPRCLTASECPNRRARLIDNLKVTGRCPVLMEDDKDWFKRKGGANVTLTLPARRVSISRTARDREKAPWEDAEIKSGFRNMMFKNEKSKLVAYDFEDIPEFLPAMDSEDSESNTAPPIFQEIPEFLQPVDAGLNDIMDDVVIKDIPEFLPDMDCEDFESNTAAPYFKDIPAFSQSVAAGLNGDVAFEELILPVLEEIPEFLQSVAAGSNNVSDVQPSKTAWVASSHEDPSSDVHPFMPTISEALGIP
ncbi:hypothetical protein BDZ97DRAFT_1923496 [Flammula alnicola]|nr:hypothetical protein BDZ97DRAFT_1923496 [Flammula alnicola]